MSAPLTISERSVPRLPRHVKLRFDQARGQFDYTDCIGERLVGDNRLLSAGVVLAGRWWHPA